MNQDKTPPTPQDIPGDEAADQETTEAGGNDPAPSDDEAAALRAEIDDLKNRLLRAVAETENLRRRAEREREETAKFAVTHFARDLLPVADNLRRALDSVPEGAAENDALASFITGVEMTERELLQVFEKHGIKAIHPLGEKFDHNLHQAMFETETDDHPPGAVTQVMQIGYVLKERLLRPAMVGVAKAKNPGTAGKTNDNPNGGNGAPNNGNGAGENIDTIA
jgi:molecular chaperone GrpE